MRLPGSATGLDYDGVGLTAFEVSEAVCAVVLRQRWSEEGRCKHGHEL